MQHSVVTHGTAARLSGLLALLRVKQWIKNAFVAAPLIFSGLFLDPKAIGDTLLAMMLFCIASSAVYVLNDMRDVESDRCHPIKGKRRPIASGAVSVTSAGVVLGLLYALIAFGYVVAPRVVTIIVCYLVVNVAYSFALKHVPVVDIFTIAIGFVLRVYAGAVALSVPVSAWMFVTTLCLALYLASVKRRQELNNSGTHGRPVLSRYSVALVERYAEMSATGALIFYSLFVVSSRPELVVTIPLVLFGLFRYWYIVETLEGGESPTDALLADWQLLATVGLWLIVCVFRLWPGASA